MPRCKVQSKWLVTDNLCVYWSISQRISLCDTDKSTLKMADLVIEWLNDHSFIYSFHGGDPLAKLCMNYASLIAELKQSYGSPNTMPSSWFTSCLPGSENQSSFGRNYTLSFYFSVSAVGFSFGHSPRPQKDHSNQRLLTKRDISGTKRGKSWLVNTSLILKNTVKSRKFSSH